MKRHFMARRFDTPAVIAAWRALDIARFVACLKQGKPDECWLWMASLRGGYGAFSVRHEPIAAHRFALELSLGRALKKGAHVAHDCDNKRCCNPKHLRESTPGDNTRAAVRRGLIPVGQARWSARLTDRQVRAIRRRRAAGESLRALSEAFGVGPSQISRIALGKQWGHLK